MRDDVRTRLVLLATLVYRTVTPCGRSVRLSSPVALVRVYTRVTMLRSERLSCERHKSIVGSGGRYGS